jgi:dUTP pyrophosphatase
MSKPISMLTKKIRIKRLDERAKLPTYAHSAHEDAGLDLYCIEDVVLEPGVPQAVRTGLAFELPAGYEGQIRPRSGWALKHGITIPNSPATIDPGYRGEVKVVLLWDGYKPTRYEVPELLREGLGGTVFTDLETLEFKVEDTPGSEYFRVVTTKPQFKFEAGERVAQIVIARYELVDWVEDTELSDTVRGSGGFGSTNVQDLPKAA